MNKQDKEHLFELAKSFHDAWNEYVLCQLKGTDMGTDKELSVLEARVRVAETDLTLFCANARF